MAIKLQKQFKKLEEEIRLSSHNGLKEKRDILQTDLENKFPAKLKEKLNITLNKSDLKFIDQGSWANVTSTTIKPKLNTNGDKSLDRDVAMFFPLTTLDSDPREIKKLIKNILTIEGGKREPKIKKPCVTVAYSKEGNEIFHIDFPIYAEHKGKFYLALGKENSSIYEWQKADPEELNEYFRKHFIDEIGNQKRRLVRFFKLWKQEEYSTSNNDHEIPPSISLTLLICENFLSLDENNDLLALRNTLQKIFNKFKITKNSGGDIVEVDINVPLPVIPSSDTLYKMKKSNEHLIKFYKKFKIFVDNIENAYNAENEHESAKYIVKSLGTKFEVPEKEAKTDDSKLKKEDRFA